MNIISSISLGVLFSLNLSVGQTYQEISIEEVREVLRIAIDLPELQQYYRIDTDSTRVPLIIKEFGLVNSKNLVGVEKFGKPVKVLPGEDINLNQYKAYLSIGDWTYVNDSFRLQLYYSVEGITINYMLKKKEGKWMLMDSKIMEE